MTIIANTLIALTGLLHIGFLVLEMFLWTGPKGRAVFRMTAEQAEATRVLAANQGLYNGFLAAGLFWSLIQAEAAFAFQLKVFFLVCVVVAAIWRVVGQAAHPPHPGRPGDRSARFPTNGILIHGIISGRKIPDHHPPLRPARLLRRRRPRDPDRRPGAEGIRRTGLCPP